jgi:threonine dehydratase
MTELREIQAASELVYREMAPTPQLCWPLLCERLGTEVWVKHENQTPVGAFKIRGGLVYFSRMIETGGIEGGVISATRGNHGQSIGYAARRHGLSATVVVPHGNSVEKNAAMRALGVKLIEHGHDFQESLEFAVERAGERALHLVPSFHPWLVAGVATYSLELFRAVEGIDVAYVPIGLGSGICGMLSARDALGLGTEVVGVVSRHADAYAQSFSRRALVESEVSTVLADGMACRRPNNDALELILAGVDRIVRVSDAEVADAMRTLFECTHNTCEGAGAAAWAAAMKEAASIRGKKVAVVASGGNIDRELFAAVLAERL